MEMFSMLVNPPVSPDLSCESRILKSVKKVVMTLMLSGKTFADLDRSKEGMGEIYSTQKRLGFFPEVVTKPKKSDEDAKKFRINGNEAYKAKLWMVALRQYTAAIRTAECGGEEMALSYANRSAVTYQLQEYQNSINDIHHALSTGQYPEHLKPKLVERRGQCFLALSQYEKAVDDFKQVVILLLNNDVNADVGNTLNDIIDLIVDCHGKKDMPLKSGHQPELTHGPSPYIQCASSAVDIKYSHKMGRHIVALVDVAPGDILAIEKPYASVLKLTDDRHWLYCHHCKKRSHSSIPCLSCIDVVFCSDICRDSAWKSYHSLECDVFHILRREGCPDNVVLGVRILMKATKLGENLTEFMDDSNDELNASCRKEKRGFVNNMYLSDDHRAVHHVMTNVEHRSRDVLLETAVLATSVVYILKETTAFFDHSDALAQNAAPFKPVSDFQWNHIVAANLLMRYFMFESHVILESKFWRSGKNLAYDRTDIGDGIYPFHSLQNHSCDPNSAVSPYDGDTLILFATKPIAKGEQIFTNYTTHYALEDKLARQARLKDQFFFTCKCHACAEDWPSAKTMPRNPQFVSQQAKKIYGAEFAKSICRMSRVCLSLVKGETTDGDRCFMRDLMILIHKAVRQPWKGSVACDDSLRFYFHVHFNKYIFSSTLQKSE